MTLDPGLWDRTPQDKRETILRAALVGAVVCRFLRVRDYEMPARDRACEIRSETGSEALARVKAAWQRALERRCEAKRKETTSNLRAFAEGGKR